MRAAPCIRGAFVVLLLGTLPLFASAQQDKNAERNARRLQLQMQNLQQQVQDAQTEKVKADADKAELEKKLAAQTRDLARAQSAVRKLNERLKATEAARAESAARVVALEKQSAEQKRASDEAMAAKARDLAQAVRFRDTQQAQWQVRYDEQVKLVADCSDKNQRLVVLGAELLDRYRRKGVTDALKQKEPFLGLTDVQMFNLVQDYRDRADAERFTPPTNR